MNAVCPIFVNVPMETYEALDRLCYQERISKAELVREAIKKEVQRRQKGQRRTCMT